jgi:mRNA interferase HigB
MVMYVNIVTRKHLSDAAESFKDTAKELRAWIAIAEAARWRNFLEVQSVFRDADSVDGYVVFNIRGNRYRLIAVIHYAKDQPKETNGHIYIWSFLRHSDYDDRKKWDPFAGE